jgi:sodium-dependent dicarboxylate transporter 2/3/5
LLFLACVLSAGAIVLALRNSDMPREAVLMLGIFVLAALLWVTEALPLFATAILIIGLQIVQLANPGKWPGFGFENGASPDYREILAPVSDPVIILFFGASCWRRRPSKRCRPGDGRSILRLFRGRPPARDAGTDERHGALLDVDEQHRRPQR